MSEFKDSGSKHILMVSGGLGRNIIYTSIVEHMKDLRFHNLDIVASYKSAFKDLINGAQMNIEYFAEHIANLGYKINYDCDPYMMHGYRTGTEHFVQCFLKNQFGLTIPRKRIKNPKLILDASEINNGIKTIESMDISGKDKIAVVQFIGGTSYYSPDKVQCTAFQKRTLSDDSAQAIVDNLVDRGYKVIQYKLPAEKKFNKTISLKKVLDFRTWAAILKISDAIVCIDSSASHMAPAVGKKALVFWSATNPVSLGWDSNVNITRVNNWKCNGCGRPNTHYFDNPKWNCKYNFECGNYTRDEALDALGGYLDKIS